ncbi:MAG: glycosyltransferase [Thermoguttaceae bacterium]|nr:glycosyltransferase [Thermoguttaceae bacterium]
MKILHVIHSVDPRSGGPSNAVRNLVQEQIALGHAVALLTTTTQSAEPWEDRSVYRGRMCNDLAFSGADVYVASAFGRYRPWSRYAFSPEAGRWLRRRFSDEATRPELVHIHGVYSHVTTASARIAARHSVPSIIRPAGVLDSCCLEMGHKRLKRAFNRLLLRADLRRAACIHATSRDEAQQLRSFLPGCVVEVVPHGVSLPPSHRQCVAERFLTRYPRLVGNRIILCMSRLHPIKRLHLAVEAFTQLLPRHPDLRLVIAGSDAGDLSGLQSSVERACIQDRVLFTGFLEGEQKAAAFAAADLFLHPSEHENYGVAVVEAMAHGVPVLTTPGVAAGEFVIRSGGGLVVEGQSASIASAIDELLGQDLRARGEDAHAFVREHLSWPAIALQIEKMYARTLARNPDQSEIKTVSELESIPL